MTSHEQISKFERHSAIDPERLKLPNGEYANKMSLQKLLLESGMPVPKIIQPNDLIPLTKLADIDMANDVQVFWEKNIWKYRIYARSYFLDPLDNFTVDTVGTECFYPPYADLPEFKQTLEKQCKDSLLSGYLHHNFDVSAIPETAYFLQHGTKQGNYQSFWERGKDIYIVKQFGQGESGSIYMFYHDGELQSNINLLGIKEIIINRYLPLLQQARGVLNNALNGSYEYKYDLIETLDEPVIIQTRVASEVTTDEVVMRDQEKIVHFIENGAGVISLEAGELNKLNDDPPDKSFILRLFNTKHHITNREDMLQLDLRKMVGLQLPYALKGGLLQHKGYNIIAYALYWGLPIEFVI